MNKQLLFIFLFAFSTLWLKAQDSTEAKVHSAHQIRTLYTEYKTIDSTLRPYEYERFNEFHADRTHYYNNGNLASKGHFKVWHLNERYNLLKGFGDFGYMNILNRVEDVPILNVKSPIAELHYMNVYRQ